MKEYHRRPLAIVAIIAALVLLLLVGACSTATPSASPQPTAVPTSEAEPTAHEAEAHEAESEGHELFVAKGCSACHGQDAEGTGAAPGLAGHGASVVRRQVRAPVGLMPVFPPDKVSNPELDILAQWVASLSGGHAHTRPADAGAAVANHHWMALFALEAGNVDEARHHVDHIIELVEGDHLSRMKKIAESLVGEDAHDAIHAIQEMLVGTVAIDLTESSMHLRLALSAVRVDDVAEAMHHVEHFISLAPDTEEAEEIVALLRDGKLPEAEHELESLLGGESGEAH